MKLLFVFILGLALFFAIQLINKLAQLIRGEGRWLNAFLRSLSVVEFVAWLVFAFWAVRIVFSELPYRSIVEGGMVVVLMLAFAWYVLRDFLCGVLLKSESGFKKGGVIKTPLISGKVVKLGYRCLYVETEKGEKVRIPYSRLNNAIISSPPEKGHGHSQMLRFDLKEGQDTAGLPDKIKEELFNMPWIIFENEPQVILLRNAQEQPQLEVKFSVIKEEHSLLVEQKLKAIIEQAAV